MNRERRLHLFVLIDALGWRILEGSAFLADLLPCRTPLRTVLGFSSGAIPTILTGVPPAQNGHWNLFYYDPKGSPFRWLRFFRFLPDRLLDNRLSRKLLKEMGRRVLGLGSQFECCVQPTLLPFFNYVEKRSIYEREGISGARSIFDQLAEKDIPYRAYSYHHWSDSEILRRAKQDMETTNVNFFFVYLSELDMFLHTYCNDAERLQQKLAWYEGELRDLFARARAIDPDARLTVFSDHGMTPVQHHFDLVGEMDNLPYKMPGDYLAVYDSTMARFWFFNEPARQDMLKRLGALPCGRIVPDAELQQLGVFFADRRYGEVIFLMNPGWLLARSDFNGRGWMPAGMHGYHPEDPYSDGIFLSNQQLPRVAPSLTDVYQCMHGAMLQEVR